MLTTLPYYSRVGDYFPILPPDALRNIFSQLLESGNLEDLNQVCRTFEFRELCFQSSFWFSTDYLKGRTQKFYFRLLLTLATIDPPLFHFLYNSPELEYDKGRLGEVVKFLARAGDLSAFTVPEMVYDAQAYTDLIVSALEGRRYDLVKKHI